MTAPQERTATTERIARLGTILGVWAHPDDEAYLSGGLMALARDAGLRVVCVTATRGEHGTSDPGRWPPDRLATARSAELEDCLSVLGVGEHHWLGYADSACAAADPAPAVARIAGIIESVRPSSVLTFPPDGLTGHQDHRAVSAWTAAAFGATAPPGARLLQAVATDRWWRRWRSLNERFPAYDPGCPSPVPECDLALDLVLDDVTLDRKVAALRAQTTQTGELIAAMGEATYAEWVREEAFIDAA